MIIAESTAGDVEARAFARGCGGTCELFRNQDAPGCLVLLDCAGSDRPGWTLAAVEPLFGGGRCGPDAGEWLFRVGLRVPREHRREFLAWYEQEHLPILLECPQWDGCRFVEAPDLHECRFVALHQLADRSALSSPERARSRATPWFMRLKQYGWFDGPFSRVLFRRIASEPSAKDCALR